MTNASPSAAEGRVKWPPLLVLPALLLVASFAFPHWTVFGLELGLRGLALLVLVAAVLWRATRPLPPPPVLGAAELAAVGFGPPVLPESEAEGRSRVLYLDLLKRTLCNLVYYESSQPLWTYGPDKLPRVAERFDVARRAAGEDVPGNALTMIGLRRLDNLQHCIEELVRRDVPGDLVETGACKGGATIFMRAVLQVLGDPQRRVYACDTFSPAGTPPSLPARLVMGAIGWTVAAVPSRRWRRWLTRRYMALPRHPNFPPVEDPSDDVVECTLFFLRSAARMRYAPRVEKDLANVQSHFARFGLLDERVRLLQGFFADTIPGDGPERIALLRCDGDTYESTRDALRLAYPRLSPGGFCIIDDYWSFDACQQAVDEYRAEHGIEEPLVRIDGLSCYWQKQASQAG